MTDETKALMERLRETYVRSVYAPSAGTGTPITRSPILKEEYLINPAGPAAADLIEAQAAEIERLREALNNVLQDNYPRPIGRHWRTDRKPSKSDLCEHDTPMWDTCINCLDAYVESALGGTDVFNTGENQ